MELADAVKYPTETETTSGRNHLIALGVIMESPRPLHGIDPYMFLPYLDCLGAYASFAARCLYLLTGRNGITAQTDLENWCEDRNDWKQFLDENQNQG